ncbi:MAG: NAAT family transporter [Myxococcales bacterium]|nr:NAAT family transporter [Myxococcales bacterium]
MDAWGSLEMFAVSLAAVFLVVDPIGVVPLFVAMTARDSREKVRLMALRACLVGAGLLAFFALFGGILFKLLGVSLGAFRVAGGLLLLVTSLDMLRARSSATRTSEEETREGVEKEDVAIVPLAIPMLAGPGSVATVMVLMSRGKTLASAIPVLASIALTFFASFYILRGAHHVKRVLRQSGVAILQRVMGLILASVAVQFIADGAADLWRS